MGNINMNKLARDITLAEGNKEDLSIAQVKEVLKLALTELAKEDIVDVIKLLRKYCECKDEGCGCTCCG